VIWTNSGYRPLLFIVTYLHSLSELKLLLVILSPKFLIKVLNIADKKQFPMVFSKKQNNLTVFLNLNLPFM